MGADLDCLPAFGAFITKSVSVPTNVGGFVISGGANRRGSEKDWERNSVHIAVLDTVISNLKETWSPLVKLHNPPRNASARRVRIRDWKRKHGHPTVGAGNLG